MTSALMVLSVLTTRASGNARWICSPRLSVLQTPSVGGIPEVGSMGLAMSISTLPARLAAPAAARASRDAAPAVALTTISPKPAASAKSPWPAAGPVAAAQAVAFGLPAWRAPISTSWPRRASLPPLALQVLEVDTTKRLGAGGDGDDPGGGTGAEQVEQQVGEQEWGQVVDSEGPFQPVLGRPAPVQDQPGVVDEDVESVGAVADLFGKPADLGLGGQVGQEHMETLVAGGGGDLAPGALTPLRIPGHQQRGGGHAGQFLGGDPTNPGGGPGDQADPAAQIGAGRAHRLTSRESRFTAAPFPFRCGAANCARPLPGGEVPTLK